MAFESAIVDFDRLPLAVREEVKRYADNEGSENWVCALFGRTTPGILWRLEFCWVDVVTSTQVVHVQYEKNGDRVDVNRSRQILFEQVGDMSSSNDRGGFYHAAINLQGKSGPDSQHNIRFTSQEDRDQVADLVKQRLAERTRAQTLPSSSEPEDLLKMLTRLHDEKLISDQEFQAARRKILAKLGLGM